MATQFSSTNSSLKELTSNDLPLLCNTLNPVASKCLALGLQLGVEYPQICATENDYRKSKDQLREIISERLKQDSPLTWYDIVTGLRSPIVGENRLARQIEQDLQQPHTSVAPQAGKGFSVPPTLPLPISAVRGQYFQSPSLMSGSQRGLPMPPHRESYQPPPQTMCQIPVRGASHRENFQPPTQMMGQTPVRRAPHGGNYQPSRHYPPYSQAWEFPGRVAHGTPQYGTRPLKYTPYIDVVNQHSDILTETISGDLTFFINKFIELGFVTRTATTNLLSQHGVGDGEKAGKLLNLLTACYNRTHNKEKWFDKFVGVFSLEPAYENLANTMTVALEKMRWSDFGTSVTEALPQLEKSPLFRSPMDAFVHYIKIGYKQCEIEKNLNVVKWPPTPSNVFINLACIDWESVLSKEEADEYTRAMVEDGNVDVIMKRKRKIDFEDIAGDLPAPNTPKRIVLVEGAPGVGKSTFAWEFCRRWERGEIAQQYKLVLLLRLRDDRMSRAKSLRDLIYHPSEDTCHFTVELVDCLGVNTLIILEGFDELPDPQHREPSIFLQLILDQLLPLATILATS